MRKIFLLLVMGIVFSGCVHANIGMSEEESVITTKEGVLSAASADLYTLSTGTELVELHDGAVSLYDYVGQKVKVSGQYSGTTLYVDEVVVIK